MTKYYQPTNEAWNPIKWYETEGKTTAIFCPAESMDEFHVLEGYSTRNFDLFERRLVFFNLKDAMEHVENIEPGTWENGFHWNSYKDCV